MDFVLNGRTHSLNVEMVRSRVPADPPHDIRTHWVEIDGHRWPAKQAFRIATGLIDEPFITHTALRIFQRLGFETSNIPRSSTRSAPAATPAAVDDLTEVSAPSAHGDAVAAFALLDDFFAHNSLTSTIGSLEAQLNGAGVSEAHAAVLTSELDEDLIDSALIIRERIGMIDTLIHAAVITVVLPLILQPGETLTKRPSLGAGNDPDRNFDLETSHRVAEFKLSSWKGSDGGRERGLFADVVGLSLDTTGRKRQVYVVGQRPVRFLTQGSRNAAKTLSKVALKLRDPAGIDASTTVSEFTKAANIEVIDLTTLLPKLR